MRSVRSRPDGYGARANATAIGASANVVVVGIAMRSGHRIGFWEFTRYGAVVAVTTLAIATPYLLFRY